MLYQLSKFQIKLSLRFSAGLSLIILLLTPLIFGVKNLDAVSASFVLERFVALIGVILLTPLFMPEQDNDIAELVKSKYTSMQTITLIRLGLSILLLLISVTLMVVFMRLNNCNFDTLDFVIGTFATAYLLGALGFASSALSNNITIGYLVPIVYYILNFASGRKLGYIYLFSLSSGDILPKYCLLAIGCLLIGIAVSKTT